LTGREERDSSWCRCGWCCCWCCRRRRRGQQLDHLVILSVLGIRCKDIVHQQLCRLGLVVLFFTWPCCLALPLPPPPRPLPFSATAGFCPQSPDPDQHEVQRKGGRGNVREEERLAKVLGVEDPLDELAGRDPDDHDHEQKQQADEVAHICRRHVNRLYPTKNKKKIFFFFDLYTTSDAASPARSWDTSGSPNHVRFFKLIKFILTSFFCTITISDRNSCSSTAHLLFFFYIYYILSFSILFSSGLYLFFIFRSFFLFHHCILSSLVLFTTF